MKTRLILYSAIVVALPIFSVALPAVCRAEETVARNVEDYIKLFPKIPASDDPRWKLVPKEEMIENLQFLVDRQNANYEKIKTWSGKYDQIRKHDFAPPPEDMSLPYNNPAAYAITKNLFTFACDLEKDRCFMRMDRVYEQYYDKNDAKIEPGMTRVWSNVASVLTSDVYYQFDFGQDQMRGELEGAMPQRVGKVCVSMPAKEQRDVSILGTLFDPRLFFYDKDRNQHNWYSLEDEYLPQLKGEKEKKFQARTLKRLAIWRGEFDGVDWRRVGYFDDDKTTELHDEFVFNGDANYNMVLRATYFRGETIMKYYAQYASDAGIFFPEKFLIEYGKEKLFRFLELKESEFNRKIPKDKFTLKELGVDENVVVLDHEKQTSYKYNKGKLSKIAEYGSAEIANEDSFWRSPSRIVAVVLGTALIAVGLAARFRRRSQTPNDAA